MEFEQRPKEILPQRLWNSKLKAFHDAITRKNWKKALNFLQYGNSSYAFSQNGNNAFHFAACCPLILKKLMCEHEEYTNCLMDFLRKKIDNSEDVVWREVFASQSYREHLDILTSAKFEICSLYSENLGINKKNINGKLPISLAVEKGAMESLNIFVKALGPNLFRNMMAAGFQPLHKPVQNKFKKEVVDIILAHDRSFLEIKDENQETPLFANIRNVDFSMVMHLITHGANMNEKDAEGHNVLEATIAYWMTNITWGEKKHQNGVELEKLFIAFIKLFSAMGYKVNEEFMLSNFVKRKGNYFNEEWSRMWSHYLKIVNNFQPITFFDAEEVSPEIYYKQKKIVENVLLPESSRGLRILSLDGGGIKGIASVIILHELENQLQKKLNNPTFHITQCFDYIGGTSTGAIIALALANGKSTTEILQLYLRFKNKVFCGRKNYDPEVLEKFLKQEFGENTTMKNISKFENLKVMVTATKADISPPELVWFRNYEIPNKISTTHFSAWFAARCSSAAPTYFSSPDNIHIDGGIMANNPSSDILLEVINDLLQKKEEERMNLTCVLSIGTGKAPPKPSCATEATNPRYYGDFYTHRKPLKALLDLFVEQVCSSDGPVVNRARATAFLKDAPFFRLSPELPYNIELDCTDDMVILDLMYAARRLISQEEKTVEELVKVLANKIEEDAVVEETLNNEMEEHNIREKISHNSYFMYLHFLCCCSMSFIIRLWIFGK